MSRPLSGVMPPVITPFQDEELDLEAFKANFERWNETGLTGYLVLGSNGENAYLSDGEKEQVLAAAREAVPPEKIFLAGAGCESTRATIHLCRRAADLGADGCLILTPAYFKGQMTAERLESHYRRVADASPRPVLIYNFPQATGLNLGPDSVARLAEHPNIVGLKDSSGNVSQLGEILRQVPAGFSVFSGNAEVFYPALCLGAVGGILAVANVVPEICLAIYDRFLSGDYTRARDLQLKVGRLAALVTRIHGVPGLKAAMMQAGYQPGGVRSPLTMPVSEVTAGLAAELKDLLQGCE
ncbi:MAG: dihydrodipicolinate synthase family protein [Thermodesulfobacteriota bacterium]